MNERLRGVSAITVVATLAVAACAGAASPSPAPPAWMPITDASAFAGATVADVAANGSGFVAVGYVVEDAARNGAIWESADGRSWQRQTVAAPNAAFLRVIRTASGLVAVSSACLGPGECVGHTFWSSSDGATWSSHESDACCWVVALASGSKGLVGVGSAFPAGYPETPENVASYVSIDGSSWASSLDGPDLLAASMGAVAPGGPGLVAIGNSGASLIAWTSADGRDWRRVPDATGLGGGEARDMVANGQRLVAVGRSGSNALAWTSADGTTWSRTADQASLQGAVMDRVAVGPGMLVAVGKDTNAGAGLVWTSADGITWTRLPDVAGGAAELNAIAASGSTFVAFGTRTDGSVVVLRAGVGT